MVSFPLGPCCGVTFAHRFAHSAYLSDFFDLRLSLVVGFDTRYTSSGYLQGSGRQFFVRFSPWITGLEMSSHSTPRSRFSSTSASRPKNTGFSLSMQSRGKAADSPAAKEPKSILKGSTPRSTSTSNIGNAMPRAVTTLRSPSVSTTHSTITTMSQRSTSPNAGARRAQRKGVAEAKRATEKELQRHMQSLLGMKQSLRRLHDEISKEFSTLTVAVEHASGARTALDHIPDGGHGLIEAMKDASCEEELVDILLSEGFHEEDIRKQIKYIVTLRRHNQLLTDLVREAGYVLSELSLMDREVQHLATLVDRACDVDLQCMNETIGDTVVCNGSPMFPNRSIEDTDAVLNSGSEVCAKAGRLSLYIRKLISTGKAEAERSAHDLQLAMSISARVAERKLSSTKREIQGVNYEIGRVNRLLAEADAEKHKVQTRLDTVVRTINLRETAKDSIFTKGGADFVCIAMRKEQQELELRLEELDIRRGSILSELEQLERDKTEYEHVLVEAAAKNEACQRMGGGLGGPASRSNSRFAGAGSRSGSQHYVDPYNSGGSTPISGRPLTPNRSRV